VFRLRGDDLVQDELRGDRRVIQARQPERGMAQHAGVADHQVLHGTALRVAEVERPGHVGGRLDDHERRQGRVGG